VRLLICILLLATPLYAQEGLSAAERTERARAHFERGKAHFNLGEYEEAVREFEAGYREKPQPLFLYNIGNAARHAGQHRKALEMYRRYLDEKPNAVERPELEQRIAELQALVAKEPPPVAPQPSVAPAPETPSPPPEIPPPPSPSPVETAPVVVTPPPPVVVVPPQPPPPAPPSWRRDWLGATLCAVGGAALLVGAIDGGIYGARWTARNDSYQAFEDARSAPPHLTADLVLLPAGAVLVLAGVIRYAVVAHRK
jgi:tetratricopeptide (TPR) repeat protein